MAGNREHCAGCRDDFYNHRETPGFDGSTECWNLKSAEIVTRYRLHWWTAPTVAGAFRKVTTNSCHHEPGQFAFYKELPDFAVDVRG